MSCQPNKSRESMERRVEADDDANGGLSGVKEPDDNILSAAAVPQPAPPNYHPRKEDAAKDGGKEDATGDNKTSRKRDIGSLGSRCLSGRNDSENGESNDSGQNVLLRHEEGRRPQEAQQSQREKLPKRIDLDDDTVEDFRRRIRGILVDRLRKHHSGGVRRTSDASNASSSSDLAAMVRTAHIVERLIHRSCVRDAEDLYRYACVDDETLDGWLQSLMSMVLKRRLAKLSYMQGWKAQSGSHGGAGGLGNGDRIDRLRRHLGHDKFQRVMRTAKTIQNMRLRHVSSSEPLPQNQDDGFAELSAGGTAAALAPSTTAIGPSLISCSSSPNLTNNNFKNNSTMPTPVRELFFRTELVGAVHGCQTSVERCDWDQLVERAEHNLQQYQTWLSSNMQQRQVKSALDTAMENPAQHHSCCSRLWLARTK